MTKIRTLQHFSSAARFGLFCTPPDAKLKLTSGCAQANGKSKSRKTQRKTKKEKKKKDKGSRGTSRKGSQENVDWAALEAADGPAFVDLEHAEWHEVERTVDEMMRVREAHNALEKEKEEQSHDAWRALARAKPHEHKEVKLKTGKTQKVVLIKGRTTVAGHVENDEDHEAHEEEKEGARSEEGDQNFIYTPP